MGMALVLTMLGACGTPKATLATMGGRGTGPVDNPHDLFIFLQEDRLPISTTPLAILKVKGNSATGPCSLEKVKTFAAEKAKASGANLMIIQKAIPPRGLWNRCHSISGVVYRVGRPADYEKEIIWTPQRKLEIADFKGGSENKPYQAATYSYFGYDVHLLPKQKKFKLSIKSYFDCSRSYFRPSTDNDRILDHEQRHFDLTELYARKLAVRMQNEIRDKMSYTERADQLSGEIHKELLSVQKAYDMDVYEDPGKQRAWKSNIHKALERYAAIREKSIIIPYE